MTVIKFPRRSPISYVRNYFARAKSAARALGARVLGACTFSRKTNLIFNVALVVLFTGFAMSEPPGWLRDFMWAVAGLNLGFALFWSLYPTISRARARELERDMALILVAAVARANAALSDDEGLNIRFTRETARDASRDA